MIKMPLIYQNLLRMQEVQKERNLVKQKQKTQQKQPPSQPPQQEEQYEEVNNYYHNENYRGNSWEHRPYRVNTVIKDHIEAHNTGSRENKTITEANIKVNTGNFTTPVETKITTIIMAITVAHMDVAMEVITNDLMVMDKVIIKAITIISTKSITHMMMAHMWNNMVCHVYSVEVLITLLIIALKENTISITSWRKMSLGSNNQHQNSLYQ